MKSRKQALIFEVENSNNYASKKQKCPESKSSLEENLTLTQAVEDYKLMAKVEGRADKTLTLYDYVFERFLEQTTEERKIADLEPRDIRAYLAFLMDDGLKNTSVAIHYRSLNVFFSWIYAQLSADSYDLEVRVAGTMDIALEQRWKTAQTARYSQLVVWTREPWKHYPLSMHHKT